MSVIKKISFKSPKHVRDHYSYRYYSDKSHVRSYDDALYKAGFGTYLLDQERSLFFKMISPCQGRILDVGTGTGKLSLYLRENDLQIIAVDASFEMLKTVRLKSHEKGLEVIFVEGDAHNLPFSDKSFETVVSSRVFMHLVDWKTALAELCRVSHKYVIIDFPPTCGFTFFAPYARRFKSLFFSDIPIYKTFSLFRIRREFIRNGFNIVEVKRGYIIPIFVHRYFNNPSLSMKLEEVFHFLGVVRFLGAPVTVKATRIY